MAQNVNMQVSPNKTSDIGLQTRLLKYLLVLAVVHAIYFFRSLLLPVSVALLLSVVLRPLVVLLKRLQIPNSIGAAIVVLLLVVFLPPARFLIKCPCLWAKSNMKSQPICPCLPP